MSAQREKFNAWYGSVRDDVMGLAFNEIAWQAWQFAESAAIERAWEAVHAERLIDPTEEHGDLVYQRAVEDCENAVFALKEKS